MPPKKSPPPFIKKILSYISCSKICPCINQRKVFVLIAWILTASSFASVLMFLRSIDEDMEHSQIVVFEKIDNSTVLYAAKSGLNLRSLFQLRKVTILLDLGMLMLLDFFSHILLIIGVMTQRSDLVTQWMSNTTIWLVLLSSATIIKFNPNPEDFEGKVVGGATLILSIRLFYGVKLYTDLSGSEPTEEEDQMETFDKLQDAEDDAEDML